MQRLSFGVCVKVEEEKLLEKDPQEGLCKEGTELSLIRTPPIIEYGLGRKILFSMNYGNMNKELE